MVDFWYLNHAFMTSCDAVPCNWVRRFCFAVPKTEREQMGILFPHNQTAYENLCAMLAETGRACVIHPTGTGKSFIGFQYAAEHPDRRILWLSPSEYICATQLENWKNAGGSLPENIGFCTYARLLLMSEAEMQELHPDVIVTDEFHRAGAEKWQEAFLRLLSLYPAALLIGLTATNIRYLDNRRDMAMEIFGGNVASEMTLGEAIVRSILPAPKYVLSVFRYRDDLEKYELRARKAKSKATRDAAEEIIAKLRRALENATGMDELFRKHMTRGKYLVFCANYQHMQEMMSFAPEWFAAVDGHPHIYSAYSDDPATSRSFAEFKSDDSDSLRLLYCIDMLNEGIHVDGVDGVILLRPTVSPIIYKQQIGRALSSSSARTPVIFDIVLNIENLYSISSLQEEMDAAMAYYLAQGGGDELVESFEIIDEVHDCLTLFDRLNETLSASWDLMYDVASAWYRDNGSIDVPNRFVTEEGYSLGPWLETQRRVRSGKVRGILTPEQIEKLDQLGMRWESAADVSWKKYYSAARQYSTEHGNLLVPYGYVTPDGVPLASWINALRTYRRSGIRTAYLTPERIAALDALGMRWDVLDYLFEQNYAAAVRYHRIHGNLDVPAAYVDPDGVRLGAWLRRLCRIREGKSQKGRLTDEQIARLDRLGMVWGNRNDLAWEKGFGYAEAYYRKNHSLNISPSYRTADGYKLGDWVSNQREKYRSGQMKDDRKKRLDAIGMVWTLPDPWELRYNLAKQYRSEHGNLDIPYNYVADGVWLGKWLGEQRALRRGKNGKILDPKHVEQLERLGMVWDKRRPYV